MTDDTMYLVHIQECITRIKSYTKKGKDEFFDSILIQDAVVRNLQTLSESTQRLSDDLRKQVKDVDWRNIAGFRNCWFTTTSAWIMQRSGRSSRMTCRPYASPWRPGSRNFRKSVRGRSLTEKRRNDA